MNPSHARLRARDPRRRLTVSLLAFFALSALLAWPCPGALAATRPHPDPRWAPPLATATGPLQVVEAFRAPPRPWLAGHRGVDLDASSGDDVVAAGPGVVAYSGWIVGRPVVVVRHGTLRTTYEPVVAAVGVGDMVSRGQLLGSLASQGWHCAPQACLHWGLIARDGGRDAYLDPMLLLRSRGPSRLLPIARVR